MAPRPNWKGYLKLSLVSCPIALYPATSASERISFRQINKKTGRDPQSGRQTCSSANALGLGPVVGQGH